MLEPYIDRVIEEFTTGDYYSEVYNAKQEFFEKAGIVYEDDADYEQRMQMFMDWYIYDRDLPATDLPPIKYFYHQHSAELHGEEEMTYKDLCKTIHSIFRMKRQTWNRKGVVVQDLFSGEKYTVNAPRINQGFSRGDIFEARLLPHKGQYEFSSGFCFHPIEMSSFITNEIKKVRHQDQSKKTKLMLQLSAMKLKHIRFNHIDVQHIYTLESRL
jgi:hypothetical protein